VRWLQALGQALDCRAGFVWPGHVPDSGLDAKSMTGKTQKGTASGRAKKTGGV